MFTKAEFINPAKLAAIAILKIFEPIKVPVTVSYLPFKANETDAAISGKLVPIANTVYPINNSPKLNSSHIWLAPKVINHAAKTRKTRDRWANCTF